MERTIMLVEDNPDDIVLAKRALKKCNLADNAVVANDGVEALEFLLGRGENNCEEETKLPAVILMDLKMPRMDGIETLKKLRDNSRTAHLPVVILTSSDEDRDIQQCYQLGANSYLRKPVDFNKFVEVMQLLGIYWLTLNELPGGMGV